MIGFDLAAVAPSVSAASADGSRAGPGPQSPEFLDVLADFVDRLDDLRGNATDIEEGLVASDPLPLDRDAAAVAQDAAGTAAVSDLGLVEEELSVDAARWLLHAALRLDAAGGPRADDSGAALDEVARELATDVGADTDPHGVADVTRLRATLAALVAGPGQPRLQTEDADAGDHDDRAPRQPVAGELKPAHPAGDAGNRLTGEVPSGDRFVATLAAEDSASEPRDPERDPRLAPRAERAIPGEGPNTGPEERASSRPAGLARPAGEVSSPTAPASTGAPPTPDAPDTLPVRSGMATTIERLVEASSRLEQLAPPRQLVMELGDMRVRLRLDEAGLRLQVLGDQTTIDRELLREASDELRSRGFDLAGGGREEEPGEGGGHQSARETPPRASRQALTESRPGTPNDGSHARGASNDTALRI